MYHGDVRKLKARKKRKYEQGSEHTETKIGETKLKRARVRGGNTKFKLMSAKFADVITDKGNLKCEILNVKDNPSNKDFTRRNIITKGAVITVKPPKGEEFQAKVTSRPGQDGIINAVKV